MSDAEAIRLGTFSLSDIYGDMIAWGDVDYIYNSSGTLLYGAGKRSVGGNSFVSVDNVSGRGCVYVYRHLGNCMSVESFAIDNCGIIEHNVLYEEANSNVNFFFCGLEDSDKHGMWLLFYSRGKMTSLFVRDGAVEDTVRSTVDETYLPGNGQIVVAPSQNKILFSAGLSIASVDFDSETGIIANPTIFDGLEGSTFEFSVSGEFLYVGLSSMVKVVRLSDMEIIDKLESNGNIWDMQMASDANIYVTTNNTKSLNVIVGADTPHPSIEIVDYDFGSGMVRLFPNYVRFCPNFQYESTSCGQVSFHYRGFQPTEIKWNFGDGQTSATINPTHTYSYAGRYDVSITATMPDGNVHCVTHSIKADGMLPPPKIRCED
ncbi:MAG: PKD domain-containing protein [Bacteroidales bacterium]|nr:PKD domain-containing protein [Bacteroidales bacterium]